MSNIDESFNNEAREMGSYNHSLVQTRITTLLAQDERFSVFVELSLAINQLESPQFGISEFKPDISLYPKKAHEPIRVKKRDILRMSEMPLLAIEILSPKQGVDDLLAKFENYFALGIKSCWLVMPAVEIVDIYSQLEQHTIFSLQHAEVIDEILDIRLPTQKIFA